jgi:hypothetical protein
MFILIQAVNNDMFLEVCKIESYIFSVLDNLLKDRIINGQKWGVVSLQYTFTVKAKVYFMFVNKCKNVIIIV